MLHRLWLIVCLLAAAPALAQEPAFAIAAEGRQLNMELAGHRVTVPGPIWKVSADGAAPQSAYVFNRLEPGVEAVTFRPDTETVITWTQIMGVIVVNRTGYTIARQVEDIAEPMRTSCTHNQFGISTVPAIAAGSPEALVMVCGRYLPTAQGKPRNCVGGLVVAVLQQGPQGALRVFREFCTAGFDFRSTDNWPVTPLQLVAYADELQRGARFAPIPASPPAASTAN